MSEPTRENPAQPGDGSRLEGHADGVVAGVLRGWAWYPQDPDRVAEIRVAAEGTPLATIQATHYRHDLEIAGKRGGCCAFDLALPATLPAGTLLEVTDVHGAPLGGSPCLFVDALPERPDPLPVALVGMGVRGFLDPIRRGIFRGWILRTDGASEAIRLAFHVDGEWQFDVVADLWREDLAERRDGEGSCGFEAPLPVILEDGRLHRLDVRIADGGASLLSRPHWIRVERGERLVDAGRVRRQPEPLRVERPAPALKLSVIVNFYNMRREAERTLTSLSRGYQRGIEDLDYEVVCIDNGSDPPLEAAWIRTFGPEFRLFRPDRLLPSPCAALNDAARTARGEYLAVMIDGAHLLTPGALREFADAVAEDAGAVVALRHWFIGGDQRWLAVAGYSRELEDRLFARIRWPKDGYDLFRIGAPIEESAEPWFDGLTESNCLFLPTCLYDAIGGFDEAFDEPGGGFANLDLMRRLAAVVPGHLVCLIGEASFHQYHGGTTTNVDDAAKDQRVRGYAARYRALRGVEYQYVPVTELQFRGSIRNERATGVRRRPLIPLGLGVSPRVRVGEVGRQLGPGLQSYVQSAYAECGLHRATRWLGHAVNMAPADLVNLQQILCELAPDRIVTVGCVDGVIVFLRSVLRMLGLSESRIVRVSGASSAPAIVDDEIAIEGDIAATSTQRATARAIGAAESVLVLYAAAEEDTVPIDALRACAGLVSPGSYLIVLGTVFGQPWLGYSTRWLRAAIKQLVAETGFVIDHGWNRQFVHTSPDGYLRRVRVSVADYDPSLDRVETAVGAALQ